jgi:hypothetical protein
MPASMNKNLNLYEDISNILSTGSWAPQTWFTGSYITNNTMATASINTNPPFSVTDKYPITNTHYTQFVMKSQLPDDLLIFVNNDVAIRQYFTEACLMYGENFVANLLNIRKGYVDTYDPWYRRISTHQHSTYPELDVGQGAYGKYYGMQKFQTMIGPNHEEVLLVWALRSTISGKPINIFLYVFAKFDYIEKRKIEKHLKAIHPYMVNISSNYDLQR